MVLIMFFKPICYEDLYCLVCTAIRSQPFRNNFSNGLLRSLCISNVLICLKAPALMLNTTNRKNLEKSISVFVKVIRGRRLL